MEKWSSPENLTKTKEPTREINRDRVSLPIDEYRDQIIEQIRINPTTIVIGETGSGKTTEIPGFLLDEFPDRKIAITEPRRIATRSVAEYVARRRETQIGEEEIGYRMRFEDVSNEETRATFLTDGILLQEIKSDPLLLKYEVVMVDEAHERSLNIDFLLGLLKKAQRERKEKGEKELKIIVTSATLEKEKFAKYFDNSGSIEVPGRTFDVAVKNKEVTNYDSRGNPDYTMAAAFTVKEIVESRQGGDILIFMPRQAEIFNTIGYIEKLNLPRLEILPLYGNLPAEDQRKVFQTFDGKRKVIIATNIAETSITINGVKHVIDSGLINEKDFDSDTGIESQTVVKHAKSGCTQRKGRAGRTAPGTCHRLYSEDDYEEREAFQKPEITRSDLAHVVLAMKKIGISNVANFDFIDPPKKEAIEQAIEKLKTLNALDEKENLTEIGKQMAELPLKPEQARMLIEAEKYGCTGSICTIVAMIGEKSVFTRPSKLEVEADMAHQNFKIPGSDFLTLLNVWDKWVENGFNHIWAKNNFLSSRQLSEAGEVRSQLMDKLDNLKIPYIDSNTGDNKKELIEKAICAGMIQDLMVSSGRGYSKLSDPSYTDPYAERIYPHPSSALFHDFSQYMIGANVRKTSKIFALLCQEVKEEWIPELAPHLVVAETTDSSNTRAYYDSNSDSVVKKTSYRFKKDVNRKIESTEVLKDTEKSSKVFIEALISGYAYSEVASNNSTKVRVLRELYNRSGGRVQVPDLIEFYFEKLKGVTSIAQLSKVPEEEWSIDIDKYRSIELMREIEEKYPTSFTSNGALFRIEYVYKQANEYSGLGLEEYEAHIFISPSLVSSLKQKNIPKIGENGRPEIFFDVQGYGYQSTKTYRKLEDALANNYNANPYERTSLSYDSPYIPRPKRSFEASALEGLGTSDKVEEEKKEKKKPQPVVKKQKPEILETVMTDELRERFNTQAEEFESLLEILKEIINNVEYKNERTEKLKIKIKEVTKKLKNDIAEIKESFVITKIRGLIGSVSGEIQRIAKDFEKLEIISSGWNDRYDLLMEKIREVALKEGLEITKENLPAIRKKVAYLATKKISEDQINGEIENIVVDVI